MEIAIPKGTLIITSFSSRGLKNSSALAPHATQHAVLVGSKLWHNNACMVGFAVGAAGAAPIIAKKLVTSSSAIVVGADAEDTFGVRDTTSHAASHGVDVGVCDSPDVRR